MPSESLEITGLFMLDLILQEKRFKNYHILKHFVGTFLLQVLKIQKIIYSFDDKNTKYERCRAIWYILILNDGMCTKNASLGNKGILEWKIQFIILPVPYSFGAFQRQNEVLQMHHDRTLKRYSIFFPSHIYIIKYHYRTGFLK